MESLKAQCSDRLLQIPVDKLPSFIHFEHVLDRLSRPDCYILEQSWQPWRIRSQDNDRNKMFRLHRVSLHVQKLGMELAVPSASTCKQCRTECKQCRTECSSCVTRCTCCSWLQASGSLPDIGLSDWGSLHSMSAHVDSQVQHMITVDGLFIMQQSCNPAYSRGHSQLCTAQHAQLLHLCDAAIFTSDAWHTPWDTFMFHPAWAAQLADSNISASAMFPCRHLSRRQLPLKLLLSSDKLMPCKAITNEALGLQHFYSLYRCAAQAQQAQLGTHCLHQVRSCAILNHLSMKGGEACMESLYQKAKCNAIYHALKGAFVNTTQEKLVLQACILGMTTNASSMLQYMVSDYSLPISHGVCKHMMHASQMLVAQHCWLSFYVQHGFPCLGATHPVTDTLFCANTITFPSL